MIRTQIQLPESEYESLRNAAGRLHRSMADCIREGIRLFLQRARPEDDLEDVIGKFRPLPMDQLKPHDRWLAEAALGGTERRSKRRRRR